MKAKRSFYEEFLFADGSIVSIVVWELPELTQERPHGYKYRLNYYTASGLTLVRYDNRQGEGDHVHILSEIRPYIFKNINQLFADFWGDVYRMQEK